MAYAALTSLASVIYQILPHDQKYHSLCAKDQMESLHQKVGHLQEFLEYFSFKSFLPMVDVFECRIRDAAYKMEDIIELVILSDPGNESESEVPTPDEFSTYFEEFHILVEKTMEMRKNLDSNAMPGKQLLTTTTWSREVPGSNGTKVGLDEPLNQILEQVNGQKPQLRIVPITGMGGIGKTTLARASYEAPQTLLHFDIRFWVTVSQDYNIKEILRGLLPEAEEQDDERLIEYVYKRLKGRRYLIVLDDMWDEKAWDRMRNAFPDDNIGSCIILTTRSSRVASYVGSSDLVHNMQFLNEDQSWDLLRENVYGQGCCSPEFESIGRRIAQNCKGLPLAIVVIAGLLKFKKSVYYWEVVAESTGEKVTTSNDHLFEILSWSYTRLPPHLRACFLYMGTYKEDYEIKTKEIVRLWAAEGFLKPKQSGSMEEVAEECLEELVERSLVLVKRRWYNGKVRTFSVHDVIREVSIRKAEEEKFQYYFKTYYSEDDVTSILAIQRRVSITDRYSFSFPRDMFSVATRSLIDQAEIIDGRRFVQPLKLLRVLNWANIQKVSEVNFLCTLTNLRYLHIFSDSEELTPILIPKSISKLQNLETLIGTVSPQSFSFPSEIWKLQRLKHIVMKQKRFILVPVPNQVCPSIETLYWVKNVDLTERFTKRFPNLKKLKLVYDNYEHEYTTENIQYLSQLEVFCIDCYTSHWAKRPPKFVFHENLKKLSLKHTEIPLESLSYIGSLPNLKVLKLRRDSVIMGDEWEPKEGEFLQLEHLKMDGIKISHWRAEDVHFPSLRKLVIVNCIYLREVPESIGEINTLETLIVRLWDDEAARSAQKIKENQEQMGNHLLQVIILDNLENDR